MVQRLVVHVSQCERTQVASACGRRSLGQRANGRTNAGPIWNASASSVWSRGSRFVFTNILD